MLYNLVFYCGRVCYFYLGQPVTLGIRIITPFSEMFKVVTKIGKDMNKWIIANNIATLGPPFLRYHVIDMRGFMDITYGIPVGEALPDDGLVISDKLAAGRYVSLIFTGSGLAGNKALIEWAR